VKDKTTGAILLRGACENGVYMFPNSLVASPTPTKVVYVHERTSLDGWHKRLGRPLIKIIQHFVNKLSLPVSTKKFSSLCTSCSKNKAHKHPFGSTSFQSHSPLDIIYTDVWGPAHITGFAVHAIIFFLWIIIPNICGFIQYLQNLRFLASFPNSKCWWKKDFSPPLTLCTPIMVANF
jgi:hypothetical protein